MAQSRGLQDLLDQAKGKEKTYDWLEAAELHKLALRKIMKRDFLKAGEIQERLGYCFHRAAFQAEHQKELTERMQRAIEAYEKARGFYQRLTDEQKAARMFRSDALAKHLSSQLAPDSVERRRLLDECLELERNALAAFWNSGDVLECGRTYNELPLVFWHRAMVEWDGQIVKRIVEEGRQWGEKVVAALSERGNPHEIARAHSFLATFLHFSGIFSVVDPEKQEQHRQKVVEHLRKAVEFSERVGDDYLSGLAHLWLGGNTGGEEQRRHWERMVEGGEKTRDISLKALGLNLLAYVTYWKAIATEDPDKRRKLAEEAMKLYVKAEHHYSVMSFRSVLIAPRGGLLAAPSGRSEHYLHRAEWEIDREKKLEFLEKSKEAGMKALKLAQDLGIPVTLEIVLHVLSKALEARARLEPDLDERRDLLENALKHRARNIEIMEKRIPFQYWNLGVMYNYLAEIQAELSHLEPDLNSKRRLLEAAVLSKEKCLRLIDKDIPYYERIGDTSLFAALQVYQDTYSTQLSHLYDLTNNPEHLRRAIEISQKAIKSASKLDLVSLSAESYWKIAKAQDILGEHLEAAESFEHASESYKTAAEKIPQLKDFYQDHASYMQAWSEIEKARHHHAEKHYGRAKEHYEKAANLHESAKRWSHLSLNYSAWARLEEAEDLSRRAQTEEARDLFQQAANLFAEAKISVKTKLETIEARDEKEMAAELVKASDIRREYSLGRIALEEARILDRKGDHVGSSKKYGSASAIFQKIAETESEQGRKELQPIIYLCQAWQKMMLAEAKASSVMYGEAAELFKQAREHTFDQPTSLLALANSSFCKALEAGTEFEMTSEMAKHSTAKKHFEAAERYYLKAGVESASEYAKSTYMLFDAYMYMHRAETETEPGKKAQYYQMAERLLQTAAGSYMKAKHPEKSDEVRRLLESVKEKRQLAMSLTEVLHPPTIASTTTSFSTPTPTHEQAAGLERFEHADVQANLVVRIREVKVGEDVNLRVELVNAGKAPALLIKVDEIIPEGFEIREVPEMYTSEDSYINLKGKRLNPLKTEDVKIVVNPRSKGTHIIKPRILYIDETGKYKSHEPEPVTITVKELGIGGWIKGER